MTKVLNYDFHCDLSKVILWQYDEAEKLKAIVDNQQYFMDANVEGLFDYLKHNVFDLANADSIGLSIWGALLGVPRPTYVEDGETKTFTDEQYKLLLRARIYLLTFDGSARAVNEFFHMLFPDLTVIVRDNLNMSVDIQILQDVSPDVAVLFRNPFVETFLPRPSGVRYNVQIGNIDYTQVFGFEGMEDEDGNSVAGFDQGTFVQ